MDTENASSSPSTPFTAVTVAAGLTLLAVRTVWSFYYRFIGSAWRGSKPARRYAPVVGTVLHQMYHVRRLHDYHTDLFRERKTFQLLTPAGRRQIYTCDPAVVEHILRKNFANYGKVSLTARHNSLPTCQYPLYTLDDSSSFSNAEIVSKEKRFRGNGFHPRLIRALSPSPDGSMSLHTALFSEIQFSSITIG